MTTFALVTQPERILLCKSPIREHVFPLRACFLDSTVIPLYHSTDRETHPLTTENRFVAIDLPPSAGWKEVSSTPQLVEARARARLLRVGLSQLDHYVTTTRTYYDNSLTISSLDPALYTKDPSAYVETVAEALGCSLEVAQSQVELDLACVLHHQRRAKYLELKFRAQLLETVYSIEDHERWLLALKQEVYGAGVGL